MKSWRVIIVLLAIVILLGVILGIRIINNTPEKQMEEFNEKYNQSKIESTNKNIIDNSNTEEIDYEKEMQESLNLLKKLGIKQLIRNSIGKIILALLVSIFFIFCNYKIYRKLGIDGWPINLYIILNIASFFGSFTFNDKLSLLLSTATAINTIILIVMQYKIIGINPYLLLVGLIPIIGVFLLIILLIYGECKLAAYFGKGTLFQLGLIFLPIIFYPILAFTAEE